MSSRQQSQAGSSRSSSSTRSNPAPPPRSQEPSPAATHTQLDGHCKDPQAWPLHYAAQSGNFGETRNLLQQQPLPPSRKSHYSRPRFPQGPKSVDIHARDPYGFTALHYAVRNQDRRITKYLLEFPGSSLTEIQDNIGQSALHWAAQLCLVDIVGLLCDANACVTAEDKLGWTPLHHLCSSHLAADPTYESSVLSIIRRLIRSAREDNIWMLRDKRGRTPVHIAATYGVSIPIFKELLRLDKGGAQAKDHQQWTPLHFAAFHKREDIARVLQDTGAFTSEGWSASQLHQMAGKPFEKFAVRTRRTVEFDDNSPLPEAAYPYRDRLSSIIKLKHIQPLFSSPDALKPYVKTYSNIRSRFEGRLKLDKKAMETVPKELILDLGALALYDHTVIIDDSASMSSKPAPDGSYGSRHQSVRDILDNIRFMNKVIDGSNDRGLRELFASDFDGQSRDYTRVGESKIGTCLWNAIVEPLLGGQKPEKPQVITIITDGEVDPIEAGLLERAMLQAARKMQQLRTPGALLFQFINVGKSSAESKGGDGYGLLRVLTRQSELARYVDIVDWQRDRWNVDRIINMSGCQYSSLETPELRNMARMFLGPVMRPYRESIHNGLENQSMHKIMDDTSISRSPSTRYRD